MAASIQPLILIVCLLWGPAGPSSAGEPSSPLPDLVTVRIGARLSLTTVHVDLPDGRQLALDGQHPARITLPPGSRVRLTADDERSYHGLLVVEQSNGETIATLILDRQAYLAGVLVSEMGASAPAAALEAQAVVARTLLAVSADRHPGEPGNLCDLTHCQSFRGVTESSAASEAVSATAGRVLTIMGRVVEAPYHSTCGGRTLASADVWGHETSHLCGVSDRRPDGTAYCAASPHGTWRAVVADDDLPDPRLEAERFRTAVGRRLGWNLVKSNRFTATRITAHGRAEWLLEGMGLGHCVGLCQQGAIGRAIDGASAAEILVAYYQGATAARP